jgi:hypothetical protein
MGFEHRNPVFELAKTVHASDRAATVIGPIVNWITIILIIIHGAMYM